MKIDTFSNKNTHHFGGKAFDEHPSFIRYFIVLLIISILFLLGICLFVKFPDLIKASAKLTTLNSPKPIICNSPGLLLKLFVKEGEKVSKDQIIGIIESTSNYTKILQLHDLFRQIKNDPTTNNDIDSLLNKEQKNELGELQEHYQTLVNAYLSYKNTVSNQFYIQRKKIALHDLNVLKKMATNLAEKKMLLIEDLKLNKESYDAFNALRKNDIVSDYELRIEQSKLLNKKINIPETNTQLLNNEILQSEKKMEILNIDNLITQQKILFQQALSTFQSKLEEWKRKYLLYAPQNGTIAFSSLIQVNQLLTKGTVICFVNPETTKYFAQIVIPQNNFGKVAVNQAVHLKLKSYPYKEYGYVKGKITFISEISTDSGYLAIVDIPQGLTTVFKKKLSFRDGLTADAEIVTKEYTLLERVIKKQLF